MGVLVDKFVINSANELITNLSTKVNNQGSRVRIRHSEKCIIFLKEHSHANFLLACSRKRDYEVCIEASEVELGSLSKRFNLANIESLQAELVSKCKM